MLVFYIIFFFLIIRFAVTLFNFISNPKLPSSSRKYNDLVSILIPARNEEGRIEALLQSISNQSYQNLEILILDDQSTDATFNLCTEYALLDDRFKVFKGNKLPDGWLGKNYACHQLSKLAKGKYLLFIDADTQIKEGLINSVLHRMKLGKLALLSLFTNQIMGSIGERMVVPLMHFILLNLLPLRLVRISKNSAFAAASGQFMLFESALYHHHSWHAQVKDKVLEDIELIKLIKTYRYNAEALLANGYISCRMYKSYEEGINGFSKNLLAGFNKNIGALICYLMLVMIGPLFIASYLPFHLFMFALTLIILSRVMISLLSGQHALWNVLLHPFQMATLLFIAILSVQKYLSKTITWKGRTIKQ